MSTVRRIRLAVTAGWLLAPLAACGAGGTRGLVVDRYDVAMNVLSDGSVQVAESITVRISGDDGGRFARTVSGHHLDRIFDLDASLDGRSAATSGGGTRLDRTGSLRADWVIAASAGTTHHLSLRYRLAGALSAQGPHGLLSWAALPVGRAYEIPQARIDLSIPAGSQVVTGPELDGRDFPLTRADGATAELTSIAARDAGVVSAEIVLASLSMAEPQWQYNEERALQMMPSFVAAGVCLVAIGIAVVGMVRLQYPALTAPESTPIAGSLDDVPSLAPAMVAAVVRDRLGTDSAARLGTLLDLVRRGHLRASPGGILPADPADGRPPAETELTSSHVRAVAHALWVHQRGMVALDVREVMALLTKVRRRIDRGLVEDLRAKGLVDAERLSVSRGLRATGLVSAAVGAGGVVVMDLTMGRFGPWPQLVPLSLFCMSAVLVWAGGRLPVWSESGAAARAVWRHRIDARRAVLRSAAIPAAAELEGWLPTAVACELSEDWVAAWERSGATSVPAPLAILRQYTSRL